MPQQLTWIIAAVLFASSCTRTTTSVQSGAFAPALPHGSWAFVIDPARCLVTDIAPLAKALQRASDSLPELCAPLLTQALSTTPLPYGAKSVIVAPPLTLGVRESHKIADEYYIRTYLPPQGVVITTAADTPDYLIIIHQAALTMGRTPENFFHSRCSQTGELAAGKTPVLILSYTIWHNLRQQTIEEGFYAQPLPDSGTLAKRLAQAIAPFYQESIRPWVGKPQ